MGNDGKVKLDGQRRAIREHVEKYKKYPDDRDKNFALKTIKNCQKEVQSILKKYPHLSSSWEDTWIPGAKER